MKFSFIVRGLCPALLLGLGACSNPADGQDTVTSIPEQLLAEVEIPGGKAQFLAVDDLLLIDTVTYDMSNPLLDPAVRGLGAAALYEYWSGEPAPAELVARTIDVPHLASSPRVAPSKRGGDERVGVVTSALTDEEFSEEQCSDGPLGPAQICNLSKTGTWEREERAQFWHGVVNPYRGDVSVQMRRRGITGWTQVWSRDITEGEVRALTATSDAINKRALKFKIFNADDDGWHAAATWD